MEHEFLTATKIERISKMFKIGDEVTVVKGVLKDYIGKIIEGPFDNFKGGQYYKVVVGYGRWQPAPKKFGDDFFFEDFELTLS